MTYKGGATLLPQEPPPIHSYSDGRGVLDLERAICVTDKARGTRRLSIPPTRSSRTTARFLSPSHLTCETSSFTGIQTSHDLPTWWMCVAEAGYSRSRSRTTLKRPSGSNFRGTPSDPRRGTRVRTGVKINVPSSPGTPRPSSRSWEIEKSPLGIGRC